MSSFYMPVRVFEEEEAVLRHAKDIKKLVPEGGCALIVTGRHSAKANGSYADVCTALESVGIRHVLFDEVEENPSTDTVMKARDLGVSENADLVIGIGGGSPLDAAKAIGHMILHKEEGIDYLYEKTADNRSLPLVLIPTTCGTGSEVTGVSVLTRKNIMTKKSIPAKIYADLALIDGKYLKTASAGTLANTAVDALTHMYESWLNSGATLYSRTFVKEGLRIWKKSLPVLLGERPAETDDFRNMMNASMYGGVAIAQTGTSVPHALSYALTTYKNVPHGKAVGYFTAGYLACAPEEDREFLLSEAGFTSLSDFQDKFLRLCGSVDVEDDFLEEDLQKLSADTARLAVAPFPCPEEVLRRIAFYTKNEAPSGAL